MAADMAAAHPHDAAARVEARPPVLPHQRRPPPAVRPHVSRAEALPPVDQAMQRRREEIRRRSLPGRASEPARAREPFVNFSVQVCFVSKYYSEPSHAPVPPCCILRSCVIRPHAHHCLGHLRAKRLCRTCSPVPSQVRRPRIRPAPHTSSRHALPLCGSTTDAMPTSSAPWPRR